MIGLREHSEGLVAFYPFNDESGNGYDGTVNGAALTADRFGNPDSSYSFDGVYDYTSARSPLRSRAGEPAPFLSGLKPIRQYTGSATDPMTARDPVAIWRMPSSRRHQGEARSA